MAPQPTPQQLDQMILIAEATINAKALEQNALSALSGLAPALVNRFFGFREAPELKATQDAAFNYLIAKVNLLDIEIQQLLLQVAAIKQARGQAASGITLASALPSNNRKI